eukprot:PITA_36618
MNLGEEIKEATLVEKILRSLSSKFESKVSAIEEKQDLQSITIVQLHGILTAFEMRKGGPSDIREAALKASAKGKEKEDLNESGYISEEEDEVNFVKKIQRGSERFRGKLPFKFFACGRVGHYAAKCPHKDNHEKGKKCAKGNRKQVVNRRSYYTHEDSDGLSNSDEDETKQDYKLPMAYDNDDFLDALEEEGFLEEITKLKICLEEKNMIIDTLTQQLTEREKQNEKLECELCSPLINTGLGYTKESSQSQKLSNTTGSYLDAAKTNEQYVNRQQKPKSTHKLNHAQFTPRMNTNRSINQKVNNIKRFYDHKNFFHGQCFSCHNFGHKASQCVSYKTIMTREARNQRSVTGIKKSSYNNFSPLEDEIESSFCNNFGHEESECRTKFRRTIQKEKTSSNSKVWRKKEFQSEICGIALFTAGQENQWYIDNGCSKHMTGDKDKLHSYNALEKEKNVSFGNDTPIVIKGKGYVYLKEKVKARNVMYVDGLKHNLLSVSQMCDQGNEVVFRSNECVVRELDIGKIVIKGTRTPINLDILKGGQKQCYLRKTDEN